MSRVLASLRAARSAPWARAAPLAAIGATVLTIALIVGDVGGWHAATSGAQHRSILFTQGSTTDAAMRSLGTDLTGRLLFDGVRWLIALAAGVVVAAASGRRWPALVLSLAYTVVGTGWVLASGRLPYVEMSLGRGDQTDTAITLAGIAGLLAAALLVSTLCWVVRGVQAAATRRGPPAPPVASRRGDNDRRGHARRARAPAARAPPRARQARRTRRVDRSRRAGHRAARHRAGMRPGRLSAARAACTSGRARCRDRQRRAVDSRDVDRRGALLVDAPIIDSVPGVVALWVAWAVLGLGGGWAVAARAGRSTAPAA